MAENDVKTPDITKLAKAGAPVRVDFSDNKPQPASTDNGNGAAAAAAATTPSVTETPEAKAAAEAAAAAAEAEKNKLPDLSDEQLKKLFADKGIEGFESFDKLKEKIAKADAPVDTPLTDEQKKANELAFEKRMLDYHIANGGTAEQFVALKQVASMDLKELSVAEIRKELKEKKFTDDEINVVLKERYYQLNPDEVQKNRTWNEDTGEWIEESDEDFNKRKEFLKKKVAAFSPKLETRSTHTKQNAEGFLNTLRDAIKAEDLAKQKETEFSSKVDEMSKKVSRKVTFELGEVDKTKIDPVEYNVSDADVAEVVGILKDPAKRQQYFFNEDKTLNLSKVMDVMLRNKYLESALKTTFIEGGNRQVAAFQKVFPNAAQTLGVGGAPATANTGRKGVIAKAGKPEVARPTT